MSKYYDVLAQDTSDVWELTAFRRGFLNLPVPANDADLNAALKKQYLALKARERMSSQLKETYARLADMASYDASADVTKSVDSLYGAAKAVKASDLPNEDQKLGSLPVTPKMLIDDVVGELAVVAQNRAIMRENKRLIKVSSDIAEFFDKEKALYKDIAQDKADRYREVGEALVKGKAVVSGGLVERVLSAYDLKWPSDEKPFDDPRLIQGVVDLMDARAQPIVETSNDAADGIASSLRTLVAMQNKLKVGKAVSLQELSEQSATVKALLDSLTASSKKDTTKK